VDILWIGARTTVNPFAVQEIAEAIQGTDKIVLVKNPINPDLELWIGAIERLHKMGVKNSERFTEGSHLLENQTTATFLVGKFLSI